MDLEKLWNDAEEQLGEFRATDGFSHIDIKRMSPNKKDGYIAIEIYHPLPNYTFSGKGKDRKTAILELLRVVTGEAPPKELRD